MSEKVFLTVLNRDECTSTLRLAVTVSKGSMHKHEASCSKRKDSRGKAVKFGIRIEFFLNSGGGIIKSIYSTGWTLTSFL